MAAPPPPKKKGPLKLILLILIPLLVLGGLGTAVAVFRLDKKILSSFNKVADKSDKDDDKDDKDDDDKDDDDDDEDGDKKKSSAKDDDDDDDDDDADSSSGGSASSALAFIPSKSMAVFVVPHLDRLQSGAGTLLGRFNGTPFSRAAITREVQREMGLDPFDASSFKSMGINLGKDMAVGIAADDSVVFAVAESDKDKLEKVIRERASKKTPGVEFKTWSLSGGGKGVAMHRPGSSRPKVVWTHSKGYLVVCGGKSKTLKGSLGKAVSLSGQNRMASNSNYKKLSTKVGKHDVLLYLNGPAIKREAKQKRKRQLASAQGYMKSYYEKKKKQEEMIFAYFNGMSMGIRLQKKQTVVRSFIAVPPSARVAIRTVLEGKGDPVQIDKMLPAKPIALFSLAFNAKIAMDMLKKVMPPRSRREYDQGVQAIEQQTGLSLNDDVFKQLSGYYAAALFPPRARDIKKLMRSSRAHELAQWVALARIKESDRVDKVLTVAADLMAKNRVDLKTKKVGGSKVYTFKERGKSLVSWTIAKKHLVWGDPKRLKKTLKLMAGRGSSADIPAPAREALNRKSALAIYLDAAKVLELLQGVPGNREVQGVAAMLSPLGHATLTADVSGGGIVMDLVLGFSDGATGSAPADDSGDDSGGDSDAKPERAERASSGTGIPQCDTFLAKYKRCVKTGMPASVRPAMLKAIARMTESYRKAGSRSSAARKALGKACLRTTKTMAQSLARYNCKW